MRSASTSTGDAAGPGELLQVQAAQVLALAGCRSAAEVLLVMLDDLRYPAGKLLVAEGTSQCRGASPDTVLARFALAVKLDQLGPAVMLRALVEEWDMARIVREVH